MALHIRSWDNVWRWQARTRFKTIKKRGLGINSSKIQRCSWMETKKVPLKRSVQRCIFLPVSICSFLSGYGYQYFQRSLWLSQGGFYSVPCYILQRCSKAEEGAEGCDQQWKGEINQETVKEIFHMRERSRPWSAESRDQTQSQPSLGLSSL